jgi:hypothetical protein
MALSGTQYKSLHAALLGAFTKSSLKQMLRFEMEEDLDHIAGGGSLSEIVSALLDWSERHGRTNDLVEAAHRDNPGNQALTSVWQEITQGVQPSTNVPQPPKPQLDKPQPNVAQSSEPRKIKILFLAANPYDTDQLSLDVEMRGIKSTIREARYRDRIEMTQEEAIRFGDLRRALLNDSFDIVHFSGHGNHQGELLLEDDQRNPTPISREKLTGLFSILKGNIKVVVLNACFSEPQAKAITQHIPCAIGTSNALPDEDAIRFSAVFYEAIAHGRSIEVAFQLGLNEIEDSDMSDEQRPRICVKDGLSASDITLISR